MKLCEECLRECAEELLPNDIAILFALDGNMSFTNGVTRQEIYSLIDTMKATQINEILKKLEFVGLIKTNNTRKNIIYCLTQEGDKVLKMVLQK